MADFEDFRAEFNKISENLESCQIDNKEEPEVDFADYIVELKTKMLSPARCGIYFSKKDIRKLGQQCGENILLKQRDRMLTDLLKSIFDVDAMEKMFDEIKGHIDLKCTYYDELSEAFDQTAALMSGHKTKAQALKKSLDRILEESGGNVFA